MRSMVSATFGGTSDFQSPPSRMRFLTSVPEYSDLLYSGDLRTSKPASWNSRRVYWLFEYTIENGGHIDTTCATHSEYLFRSSTGTR